MTEGNSSPEWRLDLATLAPKAQGVVAMPDGKEYPVYALLDLPISDELQVLQVSADMAQKKTLEEQLGRARLQVKLLSRGEIPDEVLDQLSANQLLEIGRRAWGIATPPPTAGQVEPV
jgi:hypothetical protein